MKKGSDAIMCDLLAHNRERDTRSIYSTRAASRDTRSIYSTRAKHRVHLIKSKRGAMIECEIDRPCGIEGY